MNDALPVGTKVRFNTKAAWYERVGHLGVVVAPAADGRYPQPGPGEALVRLDDDPLASWTTENRPWTCITSVNSLEVIE